MASSSNQTTDRRGREKTAAAEGETIWELGPVRSRMTQNALGDHFVDQFQDNSEREPATQESNVSRAQIPTVKIEPENKSESSFGDYFKNTYAGSSNRITRTVTAIPDQKVSAATRLVQGGLTGLGTTLNHQGGLTGLGTTLNHQGVLIGLGTTLNHQGVLTGLGTTLNHQGGLTGLGTTLNHQGELTELGMHPRTLNHQGDLTGLGMYPRTLSHQGDLTGQVMYPRTLNHQGETTGLGMYSGTLNHQKNWEMMRMRRGVCDPIEGIGPGSSASSSGMRGPTDLIQSSADQFNFRMGLLERRNQQPTSNLQADISNPVSGIVGEMTLEEIERQKMKSLMDLKQWEQAQNIRLRMELEAQKRREAMAKAREDDEMMKLIQSEQLKQDLVKQDLTRQTDDSGMGEKSRQDDIDRLKKEVEMLKKQVSSKSPDNSVPETNNAPARSGVKYRLGVTARLGNPQELKKKVFERLGQDDEMKEYMGEFEEYMGEFGDAEHGNEERKWKRGNGDKDSTLKNQYCKKRKDDSHELPADLVLTELSDAGPVPAKTSGATSLELVPTKASGVIPPELVLTEFGENGPVKAQTELEKLEARPWKVSKNK